MTPTRRVNTNASPLLIRAILLVVAAGPAGVLAVRVVRTQAGTGEAALEAPSPALIVFAVAIAFAWTAMRGPVAWLVLAASLGLAWSLVCLAAIDVAVYRLPDALTLPLLAAGLIVAFLLPGGPVPDHVAGAICGWAALAGLAWAYRRWRGVDGIGLGDAKLFGAAGAWLGWEALPSVMIIACAAAFLWVGVRVLRQGVAAAQERIAFGAPLCLAILIVWLEGPMVV